MPRYIDLGKQLVRLYRLNLTCEDAIKAFLLSAETIDVPDFCTGKCEDFDKITETHEKIGYEKGYRDGYAQAVEDASEIEGKADAKRWIPVSERLPEVNTRCLCTYENKEGTCIDFGLYMKRGWFVSGVTAWMPLPEPYKEVE